MKSNKQASRKKRSQRASLWLLALATLFFTSFSFKPQPAEKYKLDFFTTHNQFYVGDKGYKTNTGSDNFWTPDAYSLRMAVGDDLLGIGIESYGHVKGELDVLDKASDETNFDKYDHVVEGGIKIRSGTLQIVNFPDYKEALSVTLSPGTYRVRVYSSSLANVDTSADEGQDHYKIEVWPGYDMRRRVLKSNVKK